MKYFLSLLVLLAPSAAFAATLSLVPTPSSIGVGDTVSITVSVQGTEDMNTFSGTLDYPASLTPVSISDGNSIVSLWVTPPAEAAQGSIPFAGLTPGGFSGSGKLFSVIFKARRAGQSLLSISGIQVLLNDGKGTPTPTTAETLALSIQPQSTGGYVEPHDSTPPEAFVPLLETGPDGKFYLDFSTVDKGSGLQYYEVAEQRPYSIFAPVFATATSPYLLKDQYLTSNIEVRAVDNQGNTELEIYPHTHILRPYEQALLIVILILAAVALYWRIRSRRAL